MPSSLYQQLNSSLADQLAELYKQIKVSNNPLQLLINACQNNPQLQSTLSMIQNSPKSPEDLFYAMARQKGVDPNTILARLK